LDWRRSLTTLPVVLKGIRTAEDAQITMACGVNGRLVSTHGGRQMDAPLSAIAARVGYASEFAFANAFKRECGIAPGRYRTMPQPAALTAAPAPPWPGTAQPPAAR